LFNARISRRISRDSGTLFARRESFPISTGANKRRNFPLPGTSTPPRKFAVRGDGRDFQCSVSEKSELSTWVSKERLGGGGEAGDVSQSKGTQMNEKRKRPVDTVLTD
jgi:hypothetical protein